jgi:hypothetical protein
MTHSNDSRRPRRTRRQFTAAALVLLASVALTQQVRAADPHSRGSVDVAPVMQAANVALTGCAA